MDVTKWMMYKHATTQTADAQDESRQPFRIGLASEEAIQIRRVVFDVHNDSAFSSTGLNEILIALSSSDEIPVANEANTEDENSFLRRPSFILTHRFIYEFKTLIGSINQKTVIYDFLPGELIIPRSPTLVQYAITSAGDDIWSAAMMLYYQKLRVSQADLMTLMNTYKAIKPATIPRVIDT